MLALHVLVWVAAHGMADTNLDSYADMLENYAWGQNWEWGSAKHPPLFAWVTGAWFSVFPQIDTAYHFLSYGNVMIGLLGVYRLAQVIERGDLALPAVMLLSMAFPYSTLAVKFNANAILLSVWPWVAVAWVHSIRATGTRGLSWSVGLGLLATLSMLGKYYSGVLLLALFLSALASTEGRQWFATPKPWVTLLVFIVSLLPHLHWLRSHDFVTLHYVSEQGSTEGTNWSMVVKFAIAPIAYWLIPWLLCTALLTDGKSTWTRTLMTGQHGCCNRGAPRVGMTRCFGSLSCHGALPCCLAPVGSLSCHCLGPSRLVLHSHCFGCVTSPWPTPTWRKPRTD